MSKLSKYLMNNPPTRSFYTTRWLWLLLAGLFCIFQFLTIPNTNGRLGVWKLMLGVAAAITGYIVGKSLMPKVSITELVAENRPCEQPDAIKLLAVCFYRGVIMLGFIIGVLLGV